MFVQYRTRRHAANEGLKIYNKIPDFFYKFQTSDATQTQQLTDYTSEEETAA